MSDILTATALRALLVSLLAGATGSSEDKWRKVIGEVVLHPLTGRIDTNWTVAVKGSAADRGAAEKAIALVRGEHPYVRVG
jgi:hypothetical protein